MAIKKHETLEPDDELEAAAAILVEKALAEEVDLGEAFALYIPTIEIGGKTVGPFELIVRRLPEPKEPAAGICMRTPEEVPEGAGRDNCVLCSEEVIFSPGMEKMVKVCMDCFVDLGPENVEQALFGNGKTH